MKSGINLIAEERQEQIEKHNRTTEDDVRFNTKGQLSVAAGILSQKYIPDDMDLIPKEWDEIIWSKMLRKPYKERLVIAGALIAAELDRLNSIDADERSVATDDAKGNGADKQK